MAGSWEQRRASNVLTAILHVETTTVAWALGLRNLRLPGPILPLSGMPFDHARNAAVKACLDGGFEYLFFLDSDVVPPNDAVMRLLATRKPVISGLYCRRSPPHAIPVMLKNGQWITEYPHNTIIEVDLVGAGCLLVHRQVFERVPAQRQGKPWYDWRVDMKGFMPDGECLSEDFTWCVHIKRHGVPVLVHTGIQCRHIGMAEARYADFRPLETTPVT